MLTEKKCSRCHEIKSSAEFYPHRRMKSGLQSHCRQCSRAWHHENKDYVKRKNREWKNANPNYPRDYQRIIKLGILPSQVAEMTLAQGDKCAGCLRPFSETFRGAHVDHCHATGVIRGLLCVDCNLSIGRLQDSPVILRRLASYIEAPPFSIKPDIPRLKKKFRLSDQRTAEAEAH